MSDLDACLLVAMAGREVEPALLEWIDRGLGGVILYARNLGDGPAAAARVGDLRARRTDLVVAVDEEGGDVTRLEASGGSSWPGNAALGRLGVPERTEAIAAALGRQIAAVGINLDLAPDADVNTEASNPVIGTRSFGTDPTAVAAHTAAYVRGLQGAGVAACAKHFPGHGPTTVDSHVGLPTVDLSAEEIGRVHGAPFRAAIDAGVAAVMTAHVAYPAIDRTPATMSRPVITGLLRERYGFAGVVVSDALGMGAIRDTAGVAAGAVAALRAGVDLLCLDGDLASARAVRRACAEAAAEDPALRRHIADAAQRVAALAARFPAVVAIGPAAGTGPAAAGSGAAGSGAGGSAAIGSGKGGSGAFGSGAGGSAAIGSGNGGSGASGSGAGGSGATGSGATGDFGPVSVADRDLGMAAAREALLVDGGDLPRCGRKVVVVEAMRRESGIGAAPARLATALEARGVEVEVVAAGADTASTATEALAAAVTGAEGVPGVPGVPGAAGAAGVAGAGLVDRVIVAVVHDAHRRDDHARLAAALAAGAAPGRLVVVETGLPAGPTPAPRVACFGAGRVNLIAVAERLTAERTQA